MKFKTCLKLLGLLAAAGVLAACGDSPPASVPAPVPASNAVPASATASPMAYVDYANSLAKSETQPALDLTVVTPPTTESGVPQPL